MSLEQHAVTLIFRATIFELGLDFVVSVEPKCLPGSAIHPARRIVSSNVLWVWEGHRLCNSLSELCNHIQLEAPSLPAIE